MPTLNATVLDDALADVSDIPEVRVDYSGRGMYGKACLAVVLPSLSDLAKMLVNIAASDDCDVALGLAEDLQADSMGRDSVFYFPGWSLDGTSTYADDDQEDDDA